MRILVLGAGGVGAAVAAIARHRDFFEHLVLADLDGDRAQAALARHPDPRYTAVALDAGDASRLSSWPGRSASTRSSTPATRG